jgi:hypothetical protein
MPQRITVKPFALRENRIAEPRVVHGYHGERKGCARTAGIGAAILLALAAAGCGGGSGSSSSTPPPSSNVSVAISPTSSTVGYGGTQQFTATVTGSSNTAVTWSVSNASSSSSSQIGTISSSGLYQAPAATSVAMENVPQLVQVTANNAGSPPTADITVPSLDSVDSVTVTATSQADTSKSASSTVTLSGLSIIAMGQCVPDPTKPPGSFNCTYSGTGTQVSRSQSAGQTIYLFVVGYGILPGTTYSISGNDVVVTQPTSAGGNFVTTNNRVPAVLVQIVVPSTAALGPRNLVVRNSGNELASFVGGLSITQ